MDSRIAALRAHVKRVQYEQFQGGPHSNLLHPLRSGARGLRRRCRCRRRRRRRYIHNEPAPRRLHTHTHTHTRTNDPTAARYMLRECLRPSTPVSFGDRCRARRRAPTATSSFTIRRCRTLEV